MEFVRNILFKMKGKSKCLYIHKLTGSISIKSKILIKKNIAKNPNIIGLIRGRPNEHD